jgi:hypothetical protein
LPRRRGRSRPAQFAGGSPAHCKTFRDCFDTPSASRPRTPAPRGTVIASMIEAVLTPHGSRPHPQLRDHRAH